MTSVDPILRKYAALMAYEYEVGLRSKLGPGADRAGSTGETVRVRSDIGAVLMSTAYGGFPEWCDPVGTLPGDERERFRLHLLRDVEVALSMHGAYETPEVSKTPFGPRYELSVSKTDAAGPIHLFSVSGRNRYSDEPGDRMASLASDLAAELSEARFSMMTPCNGFPYMFDSTAFSLTDLDGSVDPEAPLGDDHLIWLSGRVWTMLGYGFDTDAFADGVRFWSVLDENFRKSDAALKSAGFHRFATAADRGLVMDVRDDRVIVRSVDNRKSRTVVLDGTSS